MYKIELDKDVFPEVVEMLYKSSPVSLVALSITAAFFTYLLWGVVDARLLTTWLVVIQSFFVVRLINYIQYNRSGAKEVRARYWGNRNLILVFIQGLFWGGRWFPAISGKQP